MSSFSEIDILKLAIKILDATDTIYSEAVAQVSNSSITIIFDGIIKENLEILHRYLSLYTILDKRNHSKTKYNPLLIDTIRETIPIPRDSLMLIPFCSDNIIIRYKIALTQHNSFVDILDTLSNWNNVVTVQSLRFAKLLSGINKSYLHEVTDLFKEHTKKISETQELLAKAKFIPRKPK